MSVLTVAATPIDRDWRNLDPRLVKAVQVADLIIAEEKKSAIRLLVACECKDKEFLLLNEHSTDADRQSLADRIAKGGHTVFVSDAGTPCVADPDYRLVDICIRKGVEVKSVPGASSIASALSVAGFPTDRFVFMGFPPRDKNKRRAFFAEITASKYTSVFLERPYSLKQIVSDMKEIKQPLCICIAMGTEDEKNIRGNIKDIENSVEGVKDAFAVVVSPCGYK